MTQTGPRSPEAKARVSMNALKHGLRSNKIAIPGRERQADWELFLQSSIKYCDPKGPIEFALTERIATILWRLRRVPRAEKDGAVYARKHPNDEDSRLHNRIAAVLAGVREELGIVEPPDPYEYAPVPDDSGQNEFPDPDAGLGSDEELGIYDPAHPPPEVLRPPKRPRPRRPGADAPILPAAPDLHNLSRYEARLSRQLRHTVLELCDLQRIRRKS